MEETAQARFQLLDGPVALPGTCACCGSPSKPVVDFGKRVERYGRIYLCIDCVSEAGRTVGLVDRALLDKANDRILVVEHELLTYKTASENFDDTDELNSRLVGGLTRALSHPSVVGAISHVVAAAIPHGEHASNNDDSDAELPEQPKRPNLFSLVPSQSDGESSSK